jgi:membrane protease YdiL (CAAX protease family)
MSQGQGPLAPAYTETSTPSLGLVATLAWGVLGLLATFWLLLVGSVWTSPLPRLAELLPLSHILLLLVVIVALAAQRKPILAYLALKRPSRGELLRSVGFGVLGFLLLAAIYGVLGWLTAILGTEPVPAMPSTLKNAQSNFGTLATIVSLGVGMVIAAPIAEEVFYRGFLYRGLAATRLGAIGAIAVTSIVFGLVHAPGFGWQRVVGTGLIGVLLGVLRWRTDSLAGPIVTHAVMNLLGWLAAAAMLVMFVGM